MPELPPVSLVGLHGGEWYGRAAGRAVAEADLLIGAPRHLKAVGPARCRTIEMPSPLSVAVDLAGAERERPGRVCMLTSGDPGFFGLVRLASARLGAGCLSVHPAPSAVSLAFARTATPWDDALVVSAHGRSPITAAEAVRHHPKVAVLCSPETPPQSLGRMLLDPEPPARMVSVATRLGEPAETVWRGDVASLAALRFDPLSVVLFVAPVPESGARLSWGRPEQAYTHRAGMITKSEVRAVALGKLALPAAGVLWDVGAGSGSVAAECCALAPGLAVYAVERRADEIPALRANLAGAGAHVVEGEAPAALAPLPDPDRAFVGGGGIAVLDAVLGRLRPGGVVVATYASPARATAAAERLGSMAQISVSRGVPAGADGTLRLAAENPVFVCWGPSR